MSETKIYLELDDDINRFFAENHTDIGEILRRENIDVKVGQEVKPYLSDEGVRGKDLVTVLVASSVAIVSIAAAISLILNAFYNRPHVVVIEKWEELRDADGNIILDRDGEPQYKPDPEVIVFKGKSTSAEINADIPGMFVMKINTSSN